MVFSHGSYQYGVGPFYRLHNNGIHSRLLTDTLKRAAGCEVSHRNTLDLGVGLECGVAVGRVLRLLCLSLIFLSERYKLCLSRP